MFESTTLTTTAQELLVIFILLFPLAGAAAVACLKRHETLRNTVAVLGGGGVLILCGLLLLTARHGPVAFGWPLFMGIGFHFRVDFFGALFAFFTALVWFIAILYSWGYMSHQTARTRYYIFLILTLGGCLGVFLAGDFFSLFIFFEMMSLTSYVLVVHNETGEAMQAGRSYLFFCIIGGLAILAGMMLLLSTTATLALSPQLELLEGSGATRYLVAALMLTGFGIKAGMLPLHVWLPKAHPVAPSPASALLSGVMIKVGVYGIIRVFNLVLTPAGSVPGAWQFTNTAGYLIIWIAVATMFLGALMALRQSNLKRLLAYSSVSQMGYILLGVGCAAYLGYREMLAPAAFTYHILNHAFYKAALFLMAGAIIAHTGEQELSRLGGLVRNAPVTAAAFFTAAAGLAGFPGFNGYISKTLLHHAVAGAAANAFPGVVKPAEYLFMLTGVLTACYIFKLCSGIFSGPRPAHLAGSTRETLPEQLLFAVLGAAIIFLGLAPHAVVKCLILPATAALLQPDPGAVAALDHLHFLGAADLLGAIVPIAIGLILLSVIRNRDLSTAIRFPSFLSIDRFCYAPLSRGPLTLLTTTGGAVERVVDRFYLGVAVVCGRISRLLQLLEDRSFPAAGRRISRTTVQTRECAYRIWLTGIEKVFGTLSRWVKTVFRILIRIDYRPRDSKFFRTVNISNLDFDIVFIMLYLILVMAVLLLLNL